jgi:8-amino-7-oxononanoate synthase
VLDFTSALYLGLQHPSTAIRSWAHLTQGVPAALRESEDSRRIAGDLASLIGGEAGTLMPSTLHAFWDLFGTFEPNEVTVCVDAGTYPVGRWGVERGAARHTAAVAFRHHDVEALERTVSSGTRPGSRPVVLADGWCPGCGGPAPIPGYLDVVRRHGGLLVLDDTQALGLLGAGPSAHPPFGLGGGGSLRWHGLPPSPDVLVVASLAKGLGVPMTVMAGGRAFLATFEARSLVRVHTSPVSVAHVRAAEHALEDNRRRGDTIRRRLAAIIARFRVGATGLGVRLRGGIFPVQTVQAPGGYDPAAVYGRMLRAGVRTVVIQSPCQPVPTLAFLLTGRHTPEHIDAAIASLAAALPAARVPAGL